MAKRFEVWKSDIPEEEIEKLKNKVFSNKKIGIDDKKPTIENFNPGNLLKKIAKETEGEFQATMTENEALELKDILKDLDESQIGKIVEMQKSGKSQEEIMNFIQQS